MERHTGDAGAQTISRRDHHVAARSRIVVRARAATAAVTGSVFGSENEPDHVGDRLGPVGIVGVHGDDHIAVAVVVAVVVVVGALAGAQEPGPHRSTETSILGVIDPRDRHSVARRGRHGGGAVAAAVVDHDHSIGQPGLGHGPVNRGEKRRQSAFFVERRQYDDDHGYPVAGRRRCDHRNF